MFFSIFSILFQSHPIFFFHPHIVRHNHCYSQWQTLFSHLAKQYQAFYTLYIHFDWMFFYLGFSMYVVVSYVAHTYPLHFPILPVFLLLFFISKPITANHIIHSLPSRFCILIPKYYCHFWWFCLGECHFYFIKKNLCASSSIQVKVHWKKTLFIDAHHKLAEYLFVLVCLSL